jgi:hypothetical protein
MSTINLHDPYQPNSYTKLHYQKSEVNRTEPSYYKSKQMIFQKVKTIQLWPTKNQEVTTSKIVTFFGVPVLTQTGKASQVRMLTFSVSIWCQDLIGIGVFLTKKMSWKYYSPYKNIICISMLEK